jgi:hypothetical protein
MVVGRAAETTEARDGRDRESGEAPAVGRCSCVPGCVGGSLILRGVRGRVGDVFGPFGNGRTWW